MAADVLSEVLSAVRLTGSVFFDVTTAPPWVAEAPPSAQIADAIKPGAQHAIEYHVITRGSCWISIIDGAPFEPVQLQEGDIAVIPHGEPHVVSSAPRMRAEPDLASHRRPPDESDLPFKLRTGGDSAIDAHLMCGFFTCDVRPFNPLLEALPRFMRIGRGTSAATDALLEHFLHLASVDNAERNAVADRLAVFLPEDFDGAPADVFVANILAGPLGELAPTFAAAAKSGAPFAISGILDGQQDELLARYGEWFDELRVDKREDWVRISGRRR